MALGDGVARERQPEASARSQNCDSQAATFLFVIAASIGSVEPAVIS